MRIFAVITLLLATTFAHADTLSVKRPEKPIHFFVARYASAEGATGALRINGVRFAKFDGKGVSGSTPLVGQWLVAGKNTVDVDVVATPKREGNAAFTISLHGLPAPGFPDDSNVVWKLELPRKTTIGHHLWTFELAKGDVPATELMSKTAALTTLSDADKQQIQALAHTLLESIQKNDAAAVKKLWAFRFSELAKLMGAPESALLAGFDPAIAAMSKQFANARVAGDLQYALVADGHAVQVTRGDGHPPIVASGIGGEAALEIFVGKIDGVWTFVR